MSSDSDKIRYLRQSAVHIMLERLAEGLIAAKPTNPVEFMERELAKTRLYILPRQRFTVSDITAKIAQVSETFWNVPVVEDGSNRYASFILNECIAPMPPQLIEDIADCLTYLVDFTQADLIVSSAIRGLGSLVHACAARTGQRYTLSNWYPKGLTGDIVVQQPGFDTTEGAVYINSVEQGQRCLLLDDVLWGKESTEVMMAALKSAGAIPVAAVFVAEASDCGGRAAINAAFPDLEVISLVKFLASGSRTRADPTAPPTLAEGSSPAPSARHFRGLLVAGNPLTTVRPPVQQYTPPPPIQAEAGKTLVDTKIDRIADSFVDVPIGQTPAGYPYVKFSLTDYTPTMSPGLIEEMADCCLALAPFREANIIVAGSDRGGGPLANACSVRTGLPVCVANWYPVADDSGSPRVAVHIGYSGASTMVIHGLEANKNVIVVGDMLSSGGSAEELFRCVQKSNGRVVGAVFVSEKVNLKGRQRLQEHFPDIPVSTLCKFVAEPANPNAKISGPLLTQRFQELKLGFALGQPQSPSAPRGLSRAGARSVAPALELNPGAARRDVAGDPLEDIQIRLEDIKQSFLDTPTIQGDDKKYAAFALNECTPPIAPSFMEDIAHCLTFLFNFTQGDLLVSNAIRALGSLTHAVAARTGLPYTLCNWYPSGLDGDIVVSQDEAGFSGSGCVYLNSVEPGQRVIIIGDVLWQGTTTQQLAKACQSVGAKVVAAVYVAEASDLGGARALRQQFPMMDIFTMIKFLGRGERTEDDTRALPAVFPEDKIPEKPKDLSPVPRSEVPSRLVSAEASFVGVPILQTSAGYPYCKFALTDFVPVVQPSLIEDMADCAIAMGNFEDGDVIVSESDRGGGPLAHACAARCGLPYCLASWYPLGDMPAVQHTVHVGYSGTGTIHIHGLKAGKRVIVVDDMLSSGGTAEALFHCVSKAGCQVVGAVFVSEKVNLKGRQRLQEGFPDVKLTCLVRFVAEPACPENYTGGKRLTERFADLKFPVRAEVTEEPPEPRRGGPEGGEGTPVAPRGQRRP